MSAAAWSGTVEEFISKAGTGLLIPEVLAGYRKISDKLPEDSERRSWDHSITILCTLLNHPEFYPLRLYMEYTMPSGQKRADFIFLGGTNEAPKALVLEFKQWSKFSRWNRPLDKRPRRLFLTNSQDEKSVLHPFLQVRHYVRQLANGSQVGCRFAWDYCALLPEMLAEDIKRLLQTQAVLPDAIGKVFGKIDYAGVVETISGLLPAQITDALADAFEQSPYFPAEDLVDRIVQQSSQIIATVGSILEVPGVDITGEQLRLCQEIINAAHNKERKLFIIEGGPGSGKTYAALLILLRSFTHKINAKMAVYGSRLYTMLEDCLDGIADGNSAILSKFIELENQRNPAGLNLLICDESQRMQQKSAASIFRHTPVSVVFLDEQQRLNPTDEGTKQFFEDIAPSLSLTPVHRCLTQMLRCTGGEAYYQWAEQLISGDITEQKSALQQSWANEYTFEVANTCNEMIERLKFYGREHKVIAAASYTESAGDWTYPTSKKNTRYQDKDLTLYWRMHDDEYVEPWMYGRVDDLDKVCSIYGTQGFESDYVGIIWGRDYIWDGKSFITGDAKLCFDARYGLVSKQQWCGEALTFLKNRYRIFLTRGRRGTIVYCEDETTRQYLRNFTTMIH